MMSPSENRRSRRPYDDRADDAAHGDRRRQQPEPDRRPSRAAGRVQDEHRPRGAERDVEREDRERQRPHRRVPEQPAEALRHLRAQARARLARPAASVVTTRETSTAPSTKHDRVGRERNRRADGEQERADRRRDELVGQQERALHPGVGRCPGRRAARGPGRACCWPSRRTSPPCRARTARSGRRPMLDDVAAAIVTTRMASTTARTRLTTMTIRRRSKRSAVAPPRTPNRRTGRYSLRSAIETRNGSWVWDATSSGPAASTTPSPTLLTMVAASSQRKLRPSRAGTMVSVIGAGIRRTGGRIATSAAARRRPGRGSRTRSGRPGRSPGRPTVRTSRSPPRSRSR